MGLTQSLQQSSICYVEEGESETEWWAFHRNLPASLVRTIYIYNISHEKDVKKSQPFAFQGQDGPWVTSFPSIPHAYPLLIFLVLFPLLSLAYISCSFSSLISFFFLLFFRKIILSPLALPANRSDTTHPPFLSHSPFSLGAYIYIYTYI